MKGTGWEWADNSGSSSHVQRVANGVGSRSAEAYRAYITHGSGCTPCREAGLGGPPCAESDELWQAYQDLKAP